MGRVLVIGYGNPLRGDDGLGPHVVGELSREGAAEGVEYLAPQQLTPELAEPLSQAGLAVFIDARCDGTPGELRCETVTPGPAPAAVGHHIEPPQLLSLAQALYGAYPKAWIVSIGGECFHHRDGLSPAVAAKVPMLMQRVRDLLPTG